MSSHAIDSLKTRVSIVRVESIFINASKHLKKPDQYAKRCMIDIENHIKSLIQHCERSELRLHFRDFFKNL